MEQFMKHNFEKIKRLIRVRDLGTVKCTTCGKHFKYSLRSLKSIEEQLTVSELVCEGESSAM